jgi:hypothetical protein
VVQHAETRLHLRFHPRVLIPSARRAAILALLCAHCNSPLSIDTPRTRAVPHFAVAIAIDVSESTGALNIDDVKDAVRRFVSSMRDSVDEAALCTFTSRAAFVQLRTRDTNLLLAAVDRLAWDSTSTGLFDVLHALVDTIGFAPPTLVRAVITLSDGVDQVSFFNRWDVTAYARSAGVRLFNVAVDPNSAVGVSALRALSDSTGGTFFLEADPAQYPARFADIAGVLRRLGVP